jgi:hypothetical protein
MWRRSGDYSHHVTSRAEKGSGREVLHEQKEWPVGADPDAAFVEQRADFVTRIESYVAEHAGIAGDILAFGTRMPYSWKDPSRHRGTEWYRFQEAVKAHLDECWALLTSRFPDMVN